MSNTAENELLDCMLDDLYANDFSTGYSKNWLDSSLQHKSRAIASRLCRYWCPPAPPNLRARTNAGLCCHLVHSAVSVDAYFTCPAHTQAYQQLTIICFYVASSYWAPGSGRSRCFIFIVVVVVVVVQGEYYLPCKHILVTHSSGNKYAIWTIVCSALPDSCHYPHV